MIISKWILSVFNTFLIRMTKSNRKSDKEKNILTVESGKDRQSIYSSHITASAVQPMDRIISRRDFSSVALRLEKMTRLKLITVIKESGTKVIPCHKGDNIKLNKAINMKSC